MDFHNPDRETNASITQLLDTRQITLNFIRDIGAKSIENSESRNEEFRFCMKKQ